MTGKRTIKVNGENIAKARAKKKLDQESFARIAEVSPRTLQRAENSEMISLGMIRRIADALKVNPEELIRNESLSTSTNIRNDGYGTLTLKPTRSYKDIQQLILSHRPKSLDLDYQINPQQREIVDLVAAVIKEIQGWIAFYASGADVALEEAFDPDDPPDLAARFRKDMAITQNLVDLWEGGISVFAGHYTYRHLNWAEHTFDPYGDTVRYVWNPNARNFSVLRFFDDKTIAQRTEFIESVNYGLSSSVMGLCEYTNIDIRVDGSKQFICADDQISSEVLLDLEIPF